MNRIRSIVSIAIVLVAAAACSGSVRSIDGTPLLSASGTPVATLERAPECSRAGDLCDRMIDELNQVRNAAPNASYTGTRRLTLSGDGRFILTATLVDPANGPADVRNKIEAMLRLRKWTPDSSSTRPTWRGAEQRSGWLFTFDVAAQGSGSKLTVALYAPKPAA